MKEELSHQDESLLPVFKFDLDNRLIYANLPAAPLLKSWKFRLNERMPAEVAGSYPELFNARISHSPQDCSVQFNNCLIHFSIVPFPEAGYIGMYAYCMEMNENFVNKNSQVKVTAPA